MRMNTFRYFCGLAILFICISPLLSGDLMLKIIGDTASALIYGWAFYFGERR